MTELKITPKVNISKMSSPQSFKGEDNRAGGSQIPNEKSSKKVIYGTVGVIAAGLLAAYFMTRGKTKAPEKVLTVEAAEKLKAAVERSKQLCLPAPKASVPVAAQVEIIHGRPANPVVSAALKEKINPSNPKP